MIPYASHTNTKRNLEAMCRREWRLLISRARPQDWRSEGFPYALDNGAWSDFQHGRAFDHDAFDAMIEKLGSGADWIVLPDIVAGGIPSLELSVRHMNRVMSFGPMVLIAAQDGMTPADLAPLVGPRVGIFLGGSTEWKLAQMNLWGEFCAERGVYYHVARVNTKRRIMMAHCAGADSIDGSSASRYAVTLPMLDGAVRQSDLFSPIGANEKAGA